MLEKHRGKIADSARFVFAFVHIFVPVAAPYALVTPMLEIGSRFFLIGGVGQYFVVEYLFRNFEIAVADMFGTAYASRTVFYHYPVPKAYFYVGAQQLHIGRIIFDKRIFLVVSSEQRVASLGARGAAPEYEVFAGHFLEQLLRGGVFYKLAFLFVGKGIQIFFKIFVVYGS